MTAFSELNGKRVFITGAASGIGYALAIEFAREGADIIATDINGEGLLHLVSEIERLGRSCHIASLDVSNTDQYIALAASFNSPGALPDIVISNAGIAHLGRFEDSTVEMWRRTLDINVIGVMGGCRAFLPLLQAAGKPALLVNVASAASIAPMPNMATYAASKYAVEGFSEVLAMELQDSNIDIICVHPGVINTPIVSNPNLPQLPPHQLARLQDYYRRDGVSPAVVARDVVRAVKRGDALVFTGPGARLAVWLKRLLPRRWFRRTLISVARRSGYL